MKNGINLAIFIPLTIFLPYSFNYYPVDFGPFLSSSNDCSSPERAEAVLSSLSSRWLSFFFKIDL